MALVIELQRMEVVAVEGEVAEAKGQQHHREEEDQERRVSIQ